ncbi:MAG: DUF427 domain-containing protein [Vulcanimicrobiaceae bacterium]
MKRPQLTAGQEWVWDYPRPPRLERVSATIRIEFDGREIARSTRAWRVLETSHPPVYYIPIADIEADVLSSADGESFCEWKGVAHYYDLISGTRRSPQAAWAYAHPATAFAPIANHLAFYASRVDACYVNETRVQAQPGDFYGGWITPEIVGPFKGGAGTRGW